MRVLRDMSPVCKSSGAHRGDRDFHMIWRIKQQRKQNALCFQSVLITTQSCLNRRGACLFSADMDDELHSFYVSLCPHHTRPDHAVAFGHLGHLRAGAATLEVHCSGDGLVRYACA